MGSSVFPPSGGATLPPPVFPIQASGGVISKAPWLNESVQYVSSTGDDAHDGLGWDTAKATWYAAAQVIVATGGGTISLGPGWRAGGPVPGQGIWLNGTNASIPGFVNAGSVKMRTVGIGGSNDADQFSGQQIVGYGGSNLWADYRTKPGIWQIGSQVQWTFENIGLLPVPGFEGTYPSGLFCPIRQAVDYNRNADGSIRLLTATSTSRSGGQATHVVTLPAGISCTSGVRSGAVATLFIPRPAGVAYPPWNNGTIVWIQSTDPNYPSGAYTVSGCQSTVDDQTQWGFNYNDGGASSAPLAGTITVSSVACQPGSFVEVQTSAFQVPPTQYQVVSATPTSASQATIVLTDPWGGFSGIGSGAVPSTLAAGNYGVQIATLEIGYVANVRVIIDNTGSPHMSQATGTIDVYASGPSIQLGGARAFYPEVRNQYLEGFYPHGAGAPPYDKHRMASVAVFANNAAGAGGVRMRNLNGSQVSISGLFGEATSLVEILDRATFDTSTGYPPPPVDLVGGTNAVVRVDNLQVADAVTGGVPLLSGYYPINIRGNYDWSQVIGAAGTVTAYGTSAEWRTSNSPLKSPWAAPTGPAYGVWGGGVGGAAGTKLAGPHPASWRQISPTMARFQNLIPAPASWSPAPATGTTDPMNGTGAVTYDDTMHGSATGGILCTRTDSFFAAGGHFVMCGWINAHGGAINPQGLFQLSCSGDLVWEPVSLTGRQSDFAYSQEFGGAGWMFWYYAPKLLSGSATQTYTLYAKSTFHGSGQNMDYFGLGAFWCPPSLDDNDVMEFVGTLRAQPYYLSPGMAGTFEDQKLIGHGGLGSAKHYVSGVGSGQITVGSANGKYMELFDEVGASLGVIPLSSFTVNP